MPHLDASTTRPTRVIASDYREDNATTRVLPIPRNAPARLIASMHLTGRHLTRRARAPKWTAEYAFGSFTLTGPWLQRQLADHGIHVTQRTAYNDVQAIVQACGLVKVGQLLPQYLPDATGRWVWRCGANLYSLPAFASRVRELGRDAFQRLSQPPKDSPNTYLQCPQSFTEIRQGRRRTGALQWAIRTAYPGCRSGVGYGLAKLLRKMDLDESVAEEVVREYWEAVGDRKYPWAEARAGLRNAYRRIEPNNDEHAHARKGDGRWLLP